ncbi:MAG: thiamine phosphate synthase [Lachnospiraceae bacterium]|nr:thiamine phosphate synthase [Lachnospiraceae bacterium]
MKIEKNAMQLYAITDKSWLNGNTLASQVEDALRGGATFLQLREKNASKEEIIKEALEIKEICKKYNVPFVIDDDVDIAKEIDADGVHIGQNDASYKYARDILGDNKIIGMTAHNLEEALTAQNSGADYIGVGAVFNTSTKLDTIPMSRETLMQITSNISIPVVAIGGINENNILELKGSGVDGVAVISAIFSKEDITEAANNLLSLSKQL